MTDPIFTMTNYRWRKDLATVEWWAAVDTEHHHIEELTNYRLRVAVEESNSKADTNVLGTLYYSRNGGAYTIVNGTDTYIRPSLSSEFADDDADNVQRVSTGGTFTGGILDESGVAGDVAAPDYAGNDIWEWEFCIQFQVACAEGDNFEFRIYQDGAALDFYTIDGASSLPHLMIAAPAAVTTVVGDLTVTTAPAGVEMQGTSDGVATAIGVLTPVRGLVGSVAAASGASANAAVTYILQGTITCESAVVGDMTVIGVSDGALGFMVWGVDGGVPAEIEMQGVLAATSTVVGQLSLTLELQGTTDAQSTVSGTLTPVRGLVGPISCQSAVVGNINVTRTLQGEITADSTITGDLQPVRGLVGVVAVVSDVTAEITVEYILQGTISSESVVIGTLTPIRGLVGAPAAVTTVVGDLSVAVPGYVEMQAASDAAVAVVGELAVTYILQGVVAEQAAVVGNLDVTTAAVNMQATVDAVSAVVGTLDVERILQGIIAAVADVAADLTIPAAIVELQGTISAVATVTGDLENQAWLRGTIAAASTVTGNTDLSLALFGEITATSIVEGALTPVKQFAGVIACVTTTAGDLPVTYKLQGQIDAAAAIIGLLRVTGPAQLAGLSAAQTTVVGLLMLARELMYGTVGLEGEFDVAVALKGEFDETITLEGEFAEDVTLKGSVE